SPNVAPPRSPPPPSSASPACILLAVRASETCGSPGDTATDCPRRKWTGPKPWPSIIFAPKDAVFLANARRGQGDPRRDPSPPGKPYLYGQILSSLKSL